MPSHAPPGVTGGWALHRSVTLLHVFLLASAGILFIGATTLGWLLTTSLQRQALDDTSTSLTQYVDGVLRPQLVRNNELHISPHLPLQVKAQLRRQPDLLSVKVWRPDGTLVWTNRAPERIGQRFSSALLGDLGETIQKRQLIEKHGQIGCELRHARGPVKIMCTELRYSGITIQHIYGHSKPTGKHPSPERSQLPYFGTSKYLESGKICQP